MNRESYILPSQPPTTTRGSVISWWLVALNQQTCEPKLHYIHLARRFCPKRLTKGESTMKILLKKCKNHASTWISIKQAKRLQVLHCSFFLFFFNDSWTKQKSERWKFWNDCKKLCTRKVDYFHLMGGSWRKITLSYDFSLRVQNHASLMNMQCYQTIWNNVFLF